MEINHQTQILGLIGHNISYSLSPAIHNFSAQHLGINAVYLPFSLPATSVKMFLKSFWDIGAVGFNVTMPHKELVAKILKTAMSSVNVVHRGRARWQGQSTDGIGFQQSLEKFGVDLGQFRHFVILGSGGSCQAIVAHLSSTLRQAVEIDILRRRKRADRALKVWQAPNRKISFRNFDLKVLTELLKGRDHSTLLVQATDAPFRGDNLSGLAPALNHFSGAVMDLVYAMPSAIYLAAKARQLVAIDGLPMLVEQARSSQEIWWGQAAPYEAVMTHLRDLPR